MDFTPTGGSARMTPPAASHPGGSYLTHSGGSSSKLNSEVSSSKLTKIGSSPQTNDSVKLLATLPDKRNNFLDKITNDRIESVRIAQPIHSAEFIASDRMDITSLTNDSSYNRSSDDSRFEDFYPRSSRSLGDSSDIPMGVTMGGRIQPSCLLEVSQGDNAATPQGDNSVTPLAAETTLSNPQGHEMQSPLVIETAVSSIDTPLCIETSVETPGGDMYNIPSYQSRPVSNISSNVISKKRRISKRENSF
eukprot:GHVL01027347.1.p2 GENE.GHVL01027347.1~~GHVL01027347.1.p2  ORF type:complete len:249 (-),score=66.72 GHVL01027347.1:506-1252(-)